MNAGHGRPSNEYYYFMAETLNVFIGHDGWAAS